MLRTGQMRADKEGGTTRSLAVTEKNEEKRRVFQSAGVTLYFHSGVETDFMRLENRE